MENKPMKLYTEDQIRKAHQNGRNGGHNETWCDTDDYIKSLTPIELPSKNDFKKIVDEIVKSKNDFDEKIAISSGATLGYLWVIEQIKQQAK